MHSENTMSESSQMSQTTKHWMASLVVSVGFVFLQIPMAYLGTEMGVAGGVSEGVQTFQTGKVIGLLLTIPLLLLIAVGGRWGFARYPVGTWSVMTALFVGASVATVLLTMYRAALSFFLYLPQ